MSAEKDLDEIRKVRWEWLKDGAGLYMTEKISMTRNLYDELIAMFASQVLVHAPEECEEPKETLFGMEIEVIEESNGYFCIGGKMKGINISQ